MFIVFVNKNIDIEELDLKKMIENKMCNISINKEYYILRIKSKKGPQVNSVLPLQIFSDFIYETESRKFIKDRFGNGIVDTPVCMMHPTIGKIMGPVISILNGADMATLNTQYTSYNNTEAIYLTGTSSLFADDINMLEYSLIKYRYGHHISQYYKLQLIEKYPEKLI